MIRFKDFSISGLFGRHSAKLPIKDNRIVIVGYNGVGKSTILNAFYYIISSQWVKLDEIVFDEIIISTTTRRIRVKKTEVSSYCRRRTSLGRKVPVRYLDEIIHHWDPDDIRAFAELDLGRSRAEISRFPTLRYLPLSVTREIQFAVREVMSINVTEDIEIDNLAKIQKFFAAELGGRVLYLPTYRRIEKDIKNIFPEIENEIQEAIRRRAKPGGAADVYVELVNFGMEDVKAKIAEKLEQLRSQALSEVNSLTTKYLRDVIRDEANTYSSDLAKKIDQASLDGVFRRVDESILNSDDRSNINLVVKKIQGKKNLENNEKYVAHYIAYLIDIGERIYKFEKPVRDFVGICNSYLYGKRFVFDNIDYKFYIRYVESPDRRADGSVVSSDIQMEDLSSGEKQIVSLFSHLTLDEGTRNYIIIDEPELSLSVDWQQRFLADISATQGCAFLGAVTHSPFIFDNDLDRYAVDILKHMSTQ
ncbi:AAA family ATPase [Propylenella binzhouense]|uniref:Endonuclease GajA/Old nuclease/RecF-like AAA domain-containing protein n=1 Tax=Propylenella binzhouense TaxID=2555902 RepID=A0A964T8Q3_9HYPH|nr:AAA family ATPase [Propylenella binzhouense]MYZ50140.1 hypothetical protein [Propylenella binzhouense]